MTRIANRDTSSLVSRRVPFKANNIFAQAHTPKHGHTTLYVVYSYGEHFPLFVAETDGAGNTVWYENTDRYSVTTSKHKSQARPHYVTFTPMCTGAMQVLAREGTAGLAVYGPDTQ